MTRLRFAPVALALALAFAAPLFAASPQPELPMPISGPPAHVEDMVASRSGITPQIVPDPCDQPVYEILIPVAINAAGLNGTNYTTDYSLVNFGPDQEILVGFLPSGVSAVGQPAQRFLVRANNIYNIDNFLGGGSGRLNKTGVGAVLVSAVVSGTNTLDTNARIAGSFRVSTPQPGSSGTNSFADWAMPSGFLHGDVNAIALGLKFDDNFRTNAGLVNLDPVNTRTWTITVFAGNTMTFTQSIPPLSMGQFALPSGITPTSNGYLSLRFTPNGLPATDFRWSAFGTSADNRNGDPWLSMAYRF